MRVVSNFFRLSKFQEESALSVSSKVRRIKVRLSLKFLFSSRGTRK